MAITSKITAGVRSAILKGKEDITTSQTNKNFQNIEEGGMEHLYEEAVNQRLINQIDNNSRTKVEEGRFSSSDFESLYNYNQSASSCSSSLQSDKISHLCGVALRISKGDYTCWPLAEESGLSWITSLSILNVCAAITVRSTAIKGIIDLLAQDAREVVFSPSSRIQVLEDVGCLARARKAQGVAFVRSMECMVVWSDKATRLLQEAQKHHNRVLRFLWNVVEPNFEADLINETGSETASILHHDHQQNSVPESPLHYFHFSTSSNSLNDLNTSISSISSILPPMSGSSSPSVTQTPFSNIYQRGTSNSHGHLVLGNNNKKSIFSPLDSDSLSFSSFRQSNDQQNNGNEKALQLEEGKAGVDESERPVMMISPLQHGLAAAVAFLMVGQFFSSIVSKSILSGDYTILAVTAILPIVFVLIMFFCDNIVGSLFMIFGPVRQLNQNSRCYSGIRPSPLLQDEIEQLPHITIQMPVYKESLEGVLKPSFESIKKAIQTYELQGGSASIIVSEDGMVLVDEEERKARLAYYEENNITWIARPKHGDQGFIRPGRFKKASNLNFTYEIMRRVELRMKKEFPKLYHEISGKPILTNDDQRAFWQKTYDQTMQKILKEIHPTAAGSGVDQIGDFVLMIDSDTRIPIDCFMDAAAEMTRCKDVGILQHCSGVMQVSSSFFESCIAYFTRMINFAITFAVANGDVAPFMGHNAYLRWSAMQEVAKEEIDEKGLVLYKIWSDDHVSEDFVMALDMLDRGYMVRWATYSNNGYLEGVSLTCEDELNRWQKYAWGVSEMIFNPFKKWHKGPFTPLIRRLWFGNNAIHYKWAAGKPET